MNLNKQDYMDILDYYNINFNNYKDTKSLKKMVENIIINKICRCIKKVNNRIKDEKYSIAICNNSVINKKNLKIKGFTCKKRKNLKKYDNTNRLKKNSKNLTLKKKKKIIIY